MARLQLLGALAAAALAAAATPSYSRAELESRVLDAVRTPGTLMNAVKSIVMEAKDTAGAGASPTNVLSAVLAQTDKVLREFAGPEVGAEGLAIRPADLPEPVRDPRIPGSYWAWVPYYIGGAKASAPLNWVGNCFQSNVATATPITPGSSSSVTVTVTAAAPNATGCSDFYLLATVDMIELLYVDKPGSYNVTLPIFRGGKWAARQGVYIMRVPVDPLTALLDLIDTISLFVPSYVVGPGVDPASQQRNHDFLAGYVGINMEERANPGLLDLDYGSLLQTGDLLVIHRMDGLATLEQWGTGAATSHFTMVINQNGTPYVVESNSKGCDWPIDNLQINPWSTWIQLAINATYGVVHLPLSDAARAAWNNDNAQAYINQTLGLGYGFATFISTFWDTENTNLPWPATPEALEVVIGVLDLLAGPETTAIVLTQSLNRKLSGGKDLNLTLIEAVDYAAEQMGLSFGQAVAIPEQDGWVYPPGGSSTKSGPSMVCDSYSCAILKAAGVLGAAGNSINCVEQQNRDVYQFNIFDLSRPRPQACIDADPDVPYCQLVGRWRIPLPDANTVAPYAHMRETCPSQPFAYARSNTC